VAAAIRRLLEDPELRRRLGEEGIRTAAEYAWERRIDALEAFLEDVAGLEVLGDARRLAIEDPVAQGEDA
jgi:glycosyltransferase involved in cell wall biosynthesis